MIVEGQCAVWTAEDFLVMARIRIGLALGSGVARGWAHLGVLKALDKLGLVPDIVAGSSIGALVGGFYLAGHAQALEDWARHLTTLRMLRYLKLPLTGSGMVSGARLFQEAERYLGELSIDELPAQYVAVATDLWTGHEVWLREGKLTQAMRASLSLPGIFKPLRINGHWLVDGALVNPVPVSVCRALGAQMVISVNLNADIMGKAHEEREMPENENGETDHEKNILSSSLRHFGHGEPSTFNVMVTSLNIIQDRIARSRLAGDPPDVTINPRIGHVGLLEFDRADELIRAGEAAVERAMPEINDAISVFSALHG
jgi:NTE family protein